ncbi:MAG: carboxymuconolactone decarboxylase family protein [Methanomassiliicoccales archaeon]|nr:carboxymuconolactone decarboxylase family protein [Methanomassiliicoccales archaeon]
MSLELLAKQEPNVIRALYKLKNEVFKDCALSTKEKELIATALSCMLKCEICLEVHAQRAKDAGATKEELREAMMVAMYMSGPSAVIWTPKLDEIIK